MSDQERRQAFLAEMGLGPSWKLTLRPEQGAEDTLAEGTSSIEAASEEASREKGVAANLPQPHQDTFVVPTFPDAVQPDSAPSQDELDISKMNWAQLEQAVSVCTRCDLCKSRTRTVFGKGNQQARWLLIGEGPGRQEDRQGIPFIGPAGKLLTNMVRATGLDEGHDTFITNVVKCRPTDDKGGDRPPTPQEAQACLPYLQRQIELLAPEVMLALGKTSALTLLELPADTPVGSLRGKTYHYRDIPLIVTYHPAYLLRKLSDKSKAWRDLCLALSHDARDD